MTATPTRTTADIIEGLSRIPDGEAREAYDKALKDAYWKLRSLHRTLAIGYASVGRLLVLAHGAASPDDAHEALSGVKAALYNLASFTWPGWDEDGIDVSPAESAAGLEAALGNLAYAERLGKGDLPMSRAHWMVGAHQLTAGRYAAARSSFTEAEDAARRAGSEPDAALAAAFGLLSDVAAGEEGAEERLSDSLEHLATVEHGAMFVDQVTTARRVVGC